MGHAQDSYSLWWLTWEDDYLLIVSWEFPQHAYQAAAPWLRMHICKYWNLHRSPRAVLIGRTLQGIPATYVLTSTLMGQQLDWSPKSGKGLILQDNTPNNTCRCQWTRSSVPESILTQLILLQRWCLFIVSRLLHRKHFMYTLAALWKI